MSPYIIQDMCYLEKREFVYMYANRDIKSFAQYNGGKK